MQTLQHYQVSVSSINVKTAKSAVTLITCPWNLEGYFALILNLGFHGKEISLHVHFPPVSSLTTVVRREAVGLRLHVKVLRQDCEFTEVAFKCFITFEILHWLPPNANTVLLGSFSVQLCKNLSVLRIPLKQTKIQLY